MEVERLIASFGQVPGDGDGSGVEAVLGQLEPEIDDLRAELRAGRVRAGEGSA